MCGIFGILTLSPENIYKRIIEGLTQLQNRGYDSSGLGVIESGGKLEIHKYASTNTTDSLDNLRAKCANKLQSTSHIGIGHNR